MKTLLELKKPTVIQAGKGPSPGVIRYSGWRMEVGSPLFKAGRDLEKRARSLDSCDFEPTPTADKANR